MRQNPIQNCKNCSSKCVYDCSQLQYTIQHRTVLIISTLTSRHIAQVLSIGGKGGVILRHNIKRCIKCIAVFGLYSHMPSAYNVPVQYSLKLLVVFAKSRSSCYRILSSGSKFTTGLSWSYSYIGVGFRTTATTKTECAFMFMTMTTNVQLPLKCDYSVDAVIWQV